MARKGVFTEARLHITAGSIALLLSVWAALAVDDAIKESNASQAEIASGPIARSQQRVAPAHDTQTRGS